MNDEQFNKIVVNRLTVCSDILVTKAGEYASEKDRLHNFKRAAAILECSPEKALEGMWVKHLVSVQDLINEPKRVTKELLDEKITDSINYLLLLEGLLMEETAENERKI